MKRTFSVLIVDDEADLRAMVRRDLGTYETFEATNPTEALALLAANGPTDAIISDYHMGDENGLDFLQQVRIRWPDTVRFLLTGHRDVEIAARALNEGAVTRFFLKPWEHLALRTALRIALHSTGRPTSEFAAVAP